MYPGTLYQVGGEFTTIVTKVGKKYGYFNDDTKYPVEQRFNLSDGQSSSSYSYFKVFPSKEDYEKRLQEQNERIRLKHRLINEGPILSDLIDLPPEVINKIHAVLDEANVQ